MARYVHKTTGLWKGTRRWLGGRTFLKPQEGQDHCVLVDPKDLAGPYWALYQRDAAPVGEPYEVPCIDQCGTPVPIDWANGGVSLVCNECRPTHGRPDQPPKPKTTQRPLF